jgi:hypothetical protein
MAKIPCVRDGMAPDIGGTVAGGAKTMPRAGRRENFLCRNPLQNQSLDLSEQGFFALRISVRASLRAATARKKISPVISRNLLANQGLRKIITGDNRKLASPTRRGIRRLVRRNLASREAGCGRGKKNIGRAARSACDDFPSQEGITGNFESPSRRRTPAFMDRGRPRPTLPKRSVSFAQADQRSSRRDAPCGPAPPRLRRSTRPVRRSLGVAGCGRGRPRSFDSNVGIDNPIVVVHETFLLTLRPARFLCQPQRCWICPPFTPAAARQGDRAAHH